MLYSVISDRLPAGMMMMGFLEFFDCDAAWAGAACALSNCHNVSSNEMLRRTADANLGCSRCLGGSRVLGLDIRSSCVDVEITPTIKCSLAKRRAPMSQHTYILSLALTCWYRLYDVEPGAAPLPSAISALFTCWYRLYGAGPEAGALLLAETCHDDQNGLNLLEKWIAFLARLNASAAASKPLPGASRMVNRV